VRAKTIAAVLASAAIVGLSLPGGAIAQNSETWVVSGSGKGPAVRGGGKAHVTQEFNLAGSNGYKIRLQLKDHRQLVLEATDADIHHGTVSSVTYSLLAPQHPGSDDIKARIGGVARVDVRFIPTKTIRPPADEGPKCATGSLTTASGHYVGTISFRGEHGYMRAQAHSAPGSVEREAPPKCTRPAAAEDDPKVEKEEAETVDKVEEEEKKNKAETSGEVELTALDRSRKVYFAASRFESGSGAADKTVSTFIVFGLRHRGRLSELSTVAKFGGPSSSFQLSDPSNPNAGAIVGPPSPFSGSATFRGESAGSGSWTGDLKVELPGFGTVPLTGAGVKATMCQAPDCPSNGLFSKPIAIGSPALR
jgi:hypothetical protein